MTWASLTEHLEKGVTTLARAWRVTRRDGTVFGFTDHDRDLDFDGTVFRADSGATGRTVAQAMGLAVDNTEVLGALMSDLLEEADILAGRFDGATVQGWLVNWRHPLQRVTLFKGTMGEIQREGHAFRAEFRGLSEVLNLPQGRVYQRDCSAVLGDKDCSVNLDLPAFHTVVPVGTILEGRILTFGGVWGFADRWFERGRLVVLSGAAEGLVAQIKNDRQEPRRRVVELWQDVVAPLARGDQVRLEAGCDKRAETCRVKFNNFMMFRGFPHIPGEDWLSTFPSVNGVNDGGGLRS